ncbi:ROK family protein [Cellulomonas denverensis]|uniref:ROK family protein n=1 Tax=Cellulomonas denverensis TaxID=264297 RepID=A0A7X6QZ88_9CELL|nr:ROK family protein [Cellulomonas denverensis]NKY22943.1 ROK family protein [Cellulomonas denverensis]GIG23983.1 transcriptional regulator [Cellulomonas denverensis]
MRATGTPARQGTLREHNLRLVLGHVLDAAAGADPAPPSRADVATATGLTRGSVSALVDLLISARLIAELPPVATARAGRPAVPLVPAAGTVAGIGAEVNVDYLGVRALDLSGRVLGHRTADGDFRDSEPAAVLARLAVLIGELRADLPTDLRAAGVCLALPGLVDRVTGPLRQAPNLGWRDVDVAALLTGHPELDGLPVRLANEANLAARAESWAGQAGDSFVYVSGEVGIGAAVVLGGEVFAGRHGWAGEIGHTAVEPEGPPCTCGARGCLEQYAGKDALLRAAGRPLSESVDDLVAAAAGGDLAAATALRRGGDALGVALANFVNLVDVERVVLGGIYAPLAPWLTDPVIAQLRTRVLAAAWEDARVQVAAGGPHAALTGAALAVLRTVVEDPSAWVPLPAEA